MTINPRCPRCGEPKHAIEGVPFTRSQPIRVLDGAASVVMRRWFMCPVTGEPVVVFAVRVAK